MAETTDEPAAVELDSFTAELAAQGFAIVDGYPANNRLRAEALAKAGKAEDPSGQITPELIAATGERLAAEEADRDAAERDAARNTPTMKWTEDRLRKHAADLGLAVEGDANKAAILAAIQAAPAAENEG